MRRALSSSDMRLLTFDRRPDTPAAGRDTVTKLVLLLMGTATAAALAGCVTPTSGSAAPPSPERYAAAAARNLSAASAQENWLAAFASPELNERVAEALRSNPSLLAAQARARAAQERAAAAQGRRLPSLDLSFGAARTETPLPSGDDIVTDVLTSGVQASWEADVWGRVRSQATASSLQAAAATFDAEAAALSVAGQTATAWINLAAAQQRLALAQEDLATRERALSLTERRYEQGVLSALSLRTARSQTASARAGEAAAQDAVLAAARRLQLLLGRYPDGALRVEAALPTIAPLTAAGAPGALLAYRPDVLAAEARLEAAGFEVAAARAALLPRLSLSAGLNGQGSQLSDIADPDQLARQLAAGLTAPLFQGGALRADVRANQADQEAAAASYVGAVLDAWAEVEAAISADAALAAQEAEFTLAAEEARAAQELAEREYSRGVATIFELIDAYSRRIDAERALIAARADRISNRITYHVALGLPGLAPTTSLESAP
jgi:outer membrane protein, multidrug efflux system